MILKRSGWTRFTDQISVRHVQSLCDKVAEGFGIAQGVRVNPYTQVTICCGQSEALVAAILAGLRHLCHFANQFQAWEGKTESWRRFLVFQLSVFFLDDGVFPLFGGESFGSWWTGLRLLPLFPFGFLPLFYFGILPLF